MGRPAGKVRRIIAVLKLPQRRVPLYVSRARAIVEAVGRSAWFPSPEPSLAVVTTAIDDLAAAEAATLTRAMDTVSLRDTKRDALAALLEHLRIYVQAIADANPEHAATIIQSAGMSVKDARGPGPRVFRVKTKGGGVVDVILPSAGDRAAYEVQYSLDGGKSWLGVPQAVTNKTTVTVRGLKPGSTVSFRYRATVKGVTGDFSDVITVIVD